MKKFTVKDFIDYNAPCFSCGNAIKFKICFTDFEPHPSIPRGTSSYLRPVITANYTEIYLRITYVDTLKLYIFHKTNKILSSNQQSLTKYLSERKLFLRTECDQCQTQIESQFLEFDLEKSLVKAVEIRSEILIVTEKDNYYQINSSFDKEKSIFHFAKKDQEHPAKSHQIELPLLPKYRFKDRQHLLSKMKTYIIFS